MNGPLVTLVIPTYERPHFLGRQLAVLSQNINRNLAVVKVLDGSLQAVDENRRLCQAHPNVEHMAFGDSCDLFMRIAKGYLTVQTEFTALLADDDLLLPPGFLEGVSFLRSNPDYVSVAGRFFAYSWRREGEVINHGFMYDSPSFDQEAALDRVAMFLRNPPGPVCIYALHRTEKLKIMAQECLDHADAIDFVSMETAFDIIPCALGKVKRLPVPCYGRHQGPSTMPIYPVLNRYESDPNKYSVMKYIFHERFSPVHVALKNVLLRLGDDGHYGRAEAHDKLDEYFSLYYVSSLIRHDQHFREIWRREFGSEPVQVQ